jgi:hypothetical protein
MLIMHAGCQEAFKHAVPPQRNVRLAFSSLSTRFILTRQIDLYRLKPVPDDPPFPLDRDATGRVKPFNERINVRALRLHAATEASHFAQITMRFYRPDFCASRDDATALYPPTPLCKCSQPAVLRPDMKNKPGPSSGSGEGVQAPYRYVRSGLLDGRRLTERADVDVWRGCGERGQVVWVLGGDGHAGVRNATKVPEQNA